MGPWNGAAAWVGVEALDGCTAARGATWPLTGGSAGSLLLGGCRGVSGGSERSALPHAETDPHPLAPRAGVDSHALGALTLFLLSGCG